MARVAEAGYHVRRVEVLADIATINARHKALIAAQGVDVWVSPATATSAAA